jgi:hypothetical protein
MQLPVIISPIKSYTQQLSYFSPCQDIEKEASYDLTIDTTDYVTANNEELLRNLYDYPQ